VKKRSVSLHILIVAVLLLLSSYQASWVGAVDPEARVVSVQHPDHVVPGKPFQVVVVAEYSDKFLVDVGIWDAQTEGMIQSVTLISSFTGPGQANFAFQLTAPSVEGVWNLLALTRVWFQNAWYQDPSGGVQAFAIKIISPALPVLTLSIQGADSSISVDNRSYQLNRTKSFSLQFSPGMHTLEVNQTVPGRLGERFVFVGWSDGVQSNSREIAIAQDTSMVAIYRTEYYLSVTSDVNRVSGSGWYEQRSQATFGVDPSYTVTSWFGYVVDKYDFSHWSGDSDSTTNISSVIMNSPKNVKAEWTHSSTAPDPIAVAYVFILACVPLAARVLYLRTRNARKRAVFSFLHRSMIPLSLMAVVVIGSLSVPTVRADFNMQPNAVIVRIDDASWYYWNQTPSDTCVLWLGGGISQAATDIGGFYWINPFQYESFGTVQFIQHLTKYYCVIALDQGSGKWFDTTANRTILQEVYSIQSTIIADVHNWIKKQGYQHTYIVGYSVGGQAAALEVTLRDPQGWTNGDGLVLITVPLSSNVIEGAQNIRPNLLFLYGGNLPDYEATGREFYNNAPSEGWHGTYYYHKQFLELRDVGHELWTVRDTGAYSSKAANAVVGFIEKSKALQFAYSTSTTPIPSLNLTSVKVPARVLPDQVFFLNATISNPNSSNSTVAVIVYDHDGNALSSTVVHLAVNPTSNIRLVMPSISNASQQSVNLVLLRMVDGKWVQAGPSQQFVIMVADLVSLKVQVSVPNITVTLDGSTYTVPPDGVIRFETVRGTHSIQIQPIIELGNHTRAVFNQWEDQTVTSQRAIFLDNDAVLFAIYHKQYFVNATSQYGTVVGSGWYDEQSAATISVEPPIDSKAEVIFSHWTEDSTSSELRILLLVNGPKTVIAEWDSIHKPVVVESVMGLIVLALSLSAFTVLLIMNFRKRP
jgi:pimeloyl-ACP methyl ester carboxylesterase